MNNSCDPAPWASALQAAGFTEVNGERTLRHATNLMSVHIADDWIEFESGDRPSSSADATNRGFWKTLPSGDSTRCVAHLPRWAANSEAEADDPTTTTPARLIEWTVSTSKSGLRGGSPRPGNLWSPGFQVAIYPSESVLPFAKAS